MNKSQIFTQYNKARAAAKAGKLDLGSVNRALGILQSPIAQAEDECYHTSLTFCNCPSRYRPCKHIIAKMMAYRAEHPKTEKPTCAPAEKLPTDTSILYETSSETYMVAELVKDGYSTHEFLTPDDFSTWVRTEPHGTLLRTTNAHGRRYNHYTHFGI